MPPAPHGNASRWWQGQEPELRVHQSPLPSAHHTKSKIRYPVVSKSCMCALNPQLLSLRLGSHSCLATPTQLPLLLVTQRDLLLWTSLCQSRGYRPSPAHSRGLTCQKYKFMGLAQICKIRGSEARGRAQVCAYLTSSHAIRMHSEVYESLSWSKRGTLGRSLWPHLTFLCTLPCLLVTMTRNACTGFLIAKLHKYN